MVGRIELFSLNTNSLEPEIVQCLHQSLVDERHALSPRVCFQVLRALGQRPIQLVQHRQQQEQYLASSALSIHCPLLLDAALIVEEARSLTLQQL
jgi:hypothetical protein